MNIQSRGDTASRELRSRNKRSKTIADHEMQRTMANLSGLSKHLNSRLPSIDGGRQDSFYTQSTQLANEQANINEWNQIEERDRRKQEAQSMIQPHMKPRSDLAVIDPAKTQIFNKTFTDFGQPNQITPKHHPSNPKEFLITKKKQWMNMEQP